MCFIQSCVHDCISSAPPRSQDGVKYARDTREMPKKSSALAMPSHWLGLTFGKHNLGVNLKVLSKGSSWAVSQLHSPQQDI